MGGQYCQKGREADRARLCGREKYPLTSSQNSTRDTQSVSHRFSPEIDIWKGTQRTFLRWVTRQRMILSGMEVGQMSYQGLQFSFEDQSLSVDFYKLQTKSSMTVYEARLCAPFCITPKVLFYLPRCLDCIKPTSIMTRIPI